VLWALVCFQATIQFLLGGRTFPGRGNAGGPRKKVEFTDLAKTACFLCVGECREEDAFQLHCSRAAPAPVLFVGLVLCSREVPKGRGGRGAGASAFLPEPLSGCRLGCPEQGQAARASCSPGQAQLSRPKKTGRERPRFCIISSWLRINHNLSRCFLEA